ncbi:hypothetical protein BH09PSE5_BH09PSE5_30180 [soil metagenome]
MVCNIHADMTQSPVYPYFSTALVSAAIVVSLLALSGSPARAEKADRSKPLNVEADAGRYDDLKQVGVFTGNVVVTKGTMSMRANQIEVRQTPDGYQFGVATGAGRPATFKQKRDGVDETSEGEAERIEDDGRADTVRFINKAVIRRFRGSVLADETAGSLITYDNSAEVFSVSGGASSATASNPSGRVRAVLTPREGSEGASASSSPADAAASEAGAPASRPSLQLRPSDAIGIPR